MKKSLIFSIMVLCLLTFTSLLMVSAQASEPTVLFCDDFEAADVDFLPENWTGTSSGFMVEEEDGNKILINLGNDAHVGPTDSIENPDKWADFELTCRFKNLNNLDFRMNDEEATHVRLEGSPRGVQLFEMPGWNFLGSIPALESDKWYKLRIQAKGASIKVKIWEDGAAEPEAWSLEATTEVTSGGNMDISWMNGIAIDDFKVVAI